MQKVTYIRRRAKLKKDLGSGLLLFLGNNEVGMNYVDNTYRFRQDSTFLYFFGLDYPGLIAVIDVDDDIEIVFGNEPTIDDIVWTGLQPTLSEKASAVGICYDKLSAWRNFTGLRNELNYVITSTGARLLGTIKKPMTIEEVYQAKCSSEMSALPCHDVNNPCLENE